MEHDLAERQRESAVQFQQSCDFSADTPPATPDVVTPRTMRPSPEFVYDPDTSDTGTLLTCRFFFEEDAPLFVYFLKTNSDVCFLFGFLLPMTRVSKVRVLL